MRHHKWANRSEEQRLRCRATENRDGKIVQCSEHSRIPHEHQHRGKAFQPGYSLPTPGPMTVGPASIHNR
jgi:hypothetical protein